MDIKGYKIHCKIGEGAMASVFLATQASLGRKVALKVMTPELASQRGFTPRFLKGGRIIAYLRHPQIVNVYDFGLYRHNYYIAMEYLSGGTLEDRIRSGLTVGRSVRLIKQISMALGFAHINGVIHRDIKSQNIMFRDDDIPVLTDFGIARLMDDDPQLTIPGRTVGSPLYMSPEQVCGRKIDARADIVLPIALDTAPPQVKHPENRATSPQEHHHAQTAAPPQVNRAAEPAEIEKMRKFELELGERRRKDTERECLERQRAELERLEREKVKVEIEQSEPTQDEAVSRKRLLGTF